MMAILALLLIQTPAADSKLTVTKVRPTLVDLGPTVGLMPTTCPAT